MSTLLTSNLYLVMLAMGFGLIIGYLFGGKSARRQRRKLQQELNQQSLAYLDIKSALTALEKRRDQFDRKDRLLKHSLEKLSAAEKEKATFDAALRAQERKHYTESTRLQVAAAEARQQATRAADIAGSATRQLKRLEKLSINTQTIHAPEPKSYGLGDHVKVSVVDQHVPSVTKETVSRVSNRDSAKLTRLHSSNEERRYQNDSLQAINGIGPALERTLNQAGIHRIEQLANITDRELIDLRIPTDEAHNVAARAHWKIGAKELMDQRSSG